MLFFENWLNGQIWIVPVKFAPLLIVKNPSLKDQALVIPRGDLLYRKFIDLLKFQITNPKKQTNNNDRNSKSQTKKTIALNRFVICNLRFIWNLVLGICDLRHQTPMQSRRTLTWPKGPGFSGQNKIGYVLD
jgi:hypothetical protein